MEIKTLYFTQTTFYNTNPKGNAQKIDVLDGKFSIKGVIDEPVPAFLSLFEDYKKIVDSADREDIFTGVLTGRVSEDISNSEGLITKIINWIRKLSLTGEVVKEEDFKKKIKDHNFSANK